MSKKTPTKADLQRQVKELEKQLETAARTKENQQTLIEQYAQESSAKSYRIEDLVAKLDDAFKQVDIARVQRDKNAEDNKTANQQLAEVRGALHRMTLDRDEIRRLFQCVEFERDRAREALVEASINASRLVNAVEPRNMALACS